MNKRIRKKKHVKEFTEYGLEITFKINPDKIEIDEFCDRFIDQVEAMKCFCGGLTGQFGECRFTIEVGTIKTALQNSNTMYNWLIQQQDLGFVTFGKIATLCDSEYFLDIWNDKPTKVRCY